MATLSSRPSADEPALELHELTKIELELISALLYNVKLGAGNLYREAALNLIGKIEVFATAAYNEPTFCDDASMAVDASIDVIDGYGTRVDNYTAGYFEIIV